MEGQVTETEADRVIETGTLPFFREQEAKLRSSSSIWIVGVVLFVLVVGLLFVLDSGLEVGIYIGALLLPISLYGLYKARQTEVATAEALDHMIEVEERLETGADSDEILTHLQKRISVEDRSHVAEALRTFLAGSPSSEAVPPTARAAFSETDALAESTSFLRAVLILGGLFGTVLFFALELTELSNLAGTESLLQGLRGALASTLTGILGAVTVGFVTTQLRQRVNKIIQETETFLGGTVLPLTREEKAASPPGTEVELWEALQKEVRALNQRIDERTTLMADDAASYARSLEEVSTRLQELPQVRVPPELGNLEDVVEEFSESSNLLYRTTRELVDAVGALGVFAPAKLLRDLEEVREEMAEWRDDANDALQTMVSRTEAGQERLEKSARAMQKDTIEAVETRMTRLDEAVGQLDDAIPRLEGLVRSGVDSMESAGRNLEQVSEKVEDIPHQIKTILEEIQTEIRTFRRTADELSEQTKVMPSRIAAKLDSENGRSVRNTQTQDELMRRLRELEGLVQWHRKVRQGALWKLLGVPLLPTNRLPFMPRREG